MLGRASRVALIACLLAGALTGVAHGQPEWTTYHRDPGRSGNDPEAGQPITPALAWQSTSLGAPIWGQPLVLGSHIYVATVGDEIYGLNATTGAVEWQQSAGTPVPSGELPCGDITPTVGIVGTPVIDTSAGAIYAVADTWNASTHEAQHVLEGYRLSDGEQVLSTPVDPPGAQPKDLLQRTALNLDGGDIVFGFGGNDGDCADYRGTVVAAPLDGGAPRYWQVPIALPSLSGGAVWAPSGPAVDSAGNVYATTGNPDPPAGELATTYDYSDSVVKLDLAQDFVTDPATEHTPAPLGWFEPPNWEEESNNDLDLSSAGAELLPGGLLFQAGKDGRGYLIDEASMGTGAAAVYSHEVCGGHGSFGGDAYASGVIYIACTNGTQALAYDESARTFMPLWQGPADAFGPPIVSGGLVWVVATGGFGGGGETLYGLDPSTGVPTYVETLPSPVADHFASPSAAGARLFVATGSSVTAFQISQLPTSEGLGSSKEPEEAKNPAGSSGSSGSSTGPAVSSSGVSTACSSSPCGTSIGPSPGGPPSQLPHHSFAPAMLSQAHLYVNESGHVRVALRCPATVIKCAGSITLIAEIVHGGKLVLLTLAHTRFGPASGSFDFTIDLGPTAQTHLHRHGDHLELRVVITSLGGKVRRTHEVLT